MTRIIRLQEAASGLDVRLELIDDLAPRNAEALWAVAGEARSHDAIHAMWTGPEISCPVMAPAFPASGAIAALPLENATSFPAAGEIATVFAPAGTWRGMPAVDLFDIGVFYDSGSRLLMPMGWIMASVCARVVPDDLQALQAGCRAIRRAGACQLQFSRAA